MGAGSYAAGLGLAGFDPLATLSAPRNVTPPVSLLLDGATLDFPLDADGLYQSLHPVDQKVALAMMARFGTIAGAPSVGNRLRTIKKITPRTPAQATDAVNEAIGKMVQAGDIKIVNLTIETKSTRLFVVLSYQNLRLQTSTPRTVRVSPNAP